MSIIFALVFGNANTQDFLFKFFNRFVWIWLQFLWWPTITPIFMNLSGRKFWVFFQLQIRWNNCFDKEKFINQIFQGGSPNYLPHWNWTSNSWSVSSRNLLFGIYSLFEEIILIIFQQNLLEDIKNPILLWVCYHFEQKCKNLWKHFSKN